MTALHRLVFYYPLLGMINIFISILKTSMAESTSRDMDLIDMAAGYFAYLDYSTDSIFSFSLVKNLAQWARQAVSKAAARIDHEQELVYPTASAEVRLPIQEDYASSICNVGVLVSLSEQLLTCIQMGDYDLDGMDLGDWPAFLPRLPQVAAWL